jgi:predicted peptidase
MPPLAERRMPIWVFAGGRDPAVRAKYFYAGLNELERLGHDRVRFTVHEDRGHDVWKRVYGGQDLYDWLLSHRLGD